MARNSKTRGFFVSGTDTNVGKTVATLVLGRHLQGMGFNVGVMKPVQCGGSDAQFLKEGLSLEDDLDLINPCYAKEPLSPHLAFARAGRRVDFHKIGRAFNELCQRHEIVLVEGAGGLMAPLTVKRYNADLAKDLGLPLIIVARLGLGTINHTVLTINQAKSYGIPVSGIIYNKLTPGKKDMAMATNPKQIKRLTGVSAIAEIPYITGL